jgi:hypothetical protein
MSSRPTHFYQTRCPRCDETVRWQTETMLAYLRERGKLRREKDPGVELIVELFRNSCEDLVCAACGQRGQAVEPYSPRFEEDDWAAGRPCEVCGQPIPAERLEFMPDCKQCVECQRKQEAGSGGEAEYCPHCGTPMTVRVRRTHGLTRYQTCCPQCRR